MKYSLFIYYLIFIVLYVYLLQPSVYFSSFSNFSTSIFFFYKSQKYNILVIMMGETTQ